MGGAATPPYHKKFKAALRNRDGFFICPRLAKRRFICTITAFPNHNQKPSHEKLILVLSAVIGLAASNLLAADAKNHQVTGSVLEVNPTYVVVQKGDEKWRIACDKATLGTAKVGDKVTIQYQMVAKSVEAKADKKK